MKRRLILAAVCLIVILGLPVIWLIRGAEHTATTKQTATSGAAPSSGPTASQTAFDSRAHSTSDPASIWIVVNKQRPLNPKTYAPSDLTAVGSGQQLRAEAAGALKDMIAGAKSAGLTITPASAYRSYDTQVSVYNNEVKTNGQPVADSQSARPGYSEHQTGLAVDIAGGGCSIEDCFGTTAEGKWAAAHAYEYGYILRYTSDKTAVTGYRAEAWHFRYIGRELAAEMHRTGVKTLEEFFDLPAAPNY